LNSSSFLLGACPSLTCLCNASFCLK
jgi:hypothetical protein